MAKKKYLNVDSAGYKLEETISEHTGEANQIVVTNEDGYIDSSLINIQLPEPQEQDQNHYSQGIHQGLIFKVNDGKYTLNNNTVIESSSKSFNLPKNTKSYIYVEISTGQIIAGRSFPSNCYKLYEIQAYNDSFVVEKDYREKINLTQLIDDDDANSENKTYSASKINEMFNAGGSGHVIQENYTSIANRPNLNFVGNNIAVVDDLDHYATTVQVSSIVETLELPTEDIREDILYNKDGVLYKHYNGEWIIISKINDEGEGDETDDGDTYTYSAKKIKNLIEDAGGSGHDIQKDETSIDPQQSKLNFVGDNISVYDNNNNESTDVKVNSIITVSNLPVGSDIDENLIYNHNGVLKRYQNGDWITIGEIDDNSEGSINTTYSSDKINSLLSNTGGSGHTIKKDDTTLADQPNLNFIGDNITVTNNSDVESTDVKIDSIIEVEELPTEYDIDQNVFYNHNGILKHFDGVSWNIIGGELHEPNQDYKLGENEQVIDISNLTEINFTEGNTKIEEGVNKVKLTSISNEETFEITDFPTYLVELRPESGLLINILPSSTFQTQLGMIVSLNGDIDDFIIIKKNS